MCWASNKYINSKEGKFVGQAINTSTVKKAKLLGKQ